MSDLIDRKALMDVLGIAMECDDCEKNDAPFCGMGSEFVTACEAIAEAPSANRKGKWIKSGNKIEKEPRKIWWFECSECEFRLTSPTNRTVYNYCPRCGAEMEVSE